MLLRLRDMLPFLQGKELNEIITLLVKVCDSHDFNSFQRIDRMQKDILDLFDEIADEKEVISG